MAIAPLFISDRSTLVAKLRLSAANTESNAQDIIDEAIQKVRIGFFDALGADRVSELAAAAFVENAVTASDILRAKANSTEVAWVKLHLLRDLPTLFMDAASITQQVWNQEGQTRNSLPSETRDEIRRLEEFINKAIVDLRGATPDTSLASVSVIEPDDEQPLPGATVWHD